jgi:DNA-directed RNA polymerase specialized sigma24 family protein
VAVLRTLRRLPHLRASEQGTLQPYLRRVVVNLTRDHLRTLGGAPPVIELDESIAATRRSRLDDILAKEAVRRYRQVVSTLSRKEQAALAARIEHGLPYAHVARAAGCATEGAARVMVGRALKRVITQLSATPRRRRPHARHTSASGDLRHRQPAPARFISPRPRR